MSGFTPAPWEINFGSVIDSDGDIVAIIPDSHEPNLNLIATAPVMYGLLAAIKKYGFLNPVAETLVVELDEVLAKARGES